MTWAHHALIEGDKQGVKNGLICTILLGMLFTLCQAYEYSHAAFDFSGNIYGATFFMATGFHGFHVIVGTIFLAVCLYRAYLDQFTVRHHLGFEFAAWYWHFVDVVWLFLFACIYVWGHGPASRRRPLMIARRLLASAAPSLAMADERHYAPQPPVQVGLAGRCPRCGQGRLFDGLAEARARCRACGLDFVDPGDGAAMFVILIGNVLILAGALFVEFTF